MTMSEHESDSLRTRASLLSRLRDHENNAGWRDFYSTYWRLIYNFSRRSGLSDADAQDIVQEVLLCVSRAMPGFHYDRARGRFRSWLLTVVRTRLADHWQQRSREQRACLAGVESAQAIGKDLGDEFENCWNEEWIRHLVDSAMDRVRRRTQGRHYLLFDLVERQGLSLPRAAATAGVHLAHAYVIRHRLRKMLREEAARLNCL